MNEIDTGFSGIPYTDKQCTEAIGSEYTPTQKQIGQLKIVIDDVNNVPPDTVRSFIKILNDLLAIRTGCAQPSETPVADKVQILKGVGKMNGDGWKDTTREGEVVYVLNEELPEPYKAGQYPRIGNEIWSASTEQYDFSPASIDEVRTLIKEANGSIAHPRFVRKKLEEALALINQQAAPTPSAKVNDVVWISERENLPSVSQDKTHRWPCVFNHKRDYAEKYIKAERIADLAAKVEALRKKRAGFISDRNSATIGHPVYDPQSEAHNAALDAVLDLIGKAGE